MTFVPALVSVLALGFTVASFWWLYARRGHIRSTSTPTDFALLTTFAVFSLRIPVTFRNTGARGIAVRNMRLWFLDLKHPLEVPWRSTKKQLQPWHDDQSFGPPAPFIIGGREAHVLVAEFATPLPGFVLAPGKHSVRVDVDDDSQKQNAWRELMRFDLHVPPPPADLGKYLVYSNRVDDPFASQRISEALSALPDLLAQLPKPLPDSTPLPKMPPPDVDSA